MTLAKGTKLGSCEILSSVGKAGMGVMHRARDVRRDHEMTVHVNSWMARPC